MDRICSYIRSASFGFVDEEACACSRSWAMDDMDGKQKRVRKRKGTRVEGVGI